MSAENLFCKVYVDGPVERADLLAILQQASGGVVEGRTLYASTYELDVSENDEADPGKRNALRVRVFQRNGGHRRQAHHSLLGVG